MNRKIRKRSNGLVRSGKIQISLCVCAISSGSSLGKFLDSHGCQVSTCTCGQRKKKKVREKSRECHNHKPQPFSDTKRKRKPTKPNKRKSNKHTKSTKISSLFPKRGNCNAKRTEKKTQEQNDTR